MPVGIEIPQVRTTHALSVEELADWLRQVEQSGFHSAWVMESQLGAASSLEPLSVLAFAAGQTSTLRLGIAVAILALHQPVRLARQAATIDRLSSGGLTLGLGIGAPVLPVEAFGISASERAPRFEEYLEVMRRLWTEPQVDFEGRFVTLRQARMEPKPIQSPLPVWFGASSPPALRRTARLADGWIGAGSTPSSAFPEQAARLRANLEAEGRDPGAFPMAKRVYVAIDRPAGEVDAWFRAVYGGGIPPEVAITGSVEQVLDGLRELRQAGAELLVVAPVGDDRPQLEPIVEHVLPALG
ncbi:MAG TPA: LLM class flavin-dependent oxidoreductase [Solirubrobacteraceae bacterium]|nr:LLM class flavin-dependent oxidoreductase [Solirubrobacteraceae bacterium]